VIFFREPTYYVIFLFDTKLIT